MVVFLHHTKSGIPQVKHLPLQHLWSVDGCFYCRRESPPTVTQPLLTVLMLNSGLVGPETPLFEVCYPSWTIMAQYQSCPFRPEGREGVSVLPQKSQAASCSGISIHHVLTHSLSTSLLPLIVWLGLLLLQNHEDLVYLLFTLCSPGDFLGCYLQPLLLVWVGRVKCIVALGLLVEEGKEINCCRFPTAPCFTRVSLRQEDTV